MISEEERHAIEHARHMIACSDDEHPEICFDYELVRDLVNVVDRFEKLLRGANRRVARHLNGTEGVIEMTDQKYMRSGLNFAMGKAIEEAGEFLAAIGKTKRWGWQSYNPELPRAQRETNEQWVRRELADLRDALDNQESEMHRHANPLDAAS